MEQNNIKIKIPAAFKFLFTPMRYKGAFGGRAGGKSHSFARALLILSMQEKHKILCCREVQNSIKDSVKSLLDTCIADYGLKSFFEITRDEIRGINGSLFIFSGLSTLTSDQIKSLEGVTICWVEEAQTISSRSLEVLRPTIRKNGSEIWFTWNPRNPDDPVDKMLRANKPHNAIVELINYDKNPYFTQASEEERLFDLKNNPDRYNHIWLGAYEPVAIGALWDRRYFDNNRVFEEPNLKRILVSVDPAITGNVDSDYHGIVVVGQGVDGKGYVLADESLKGMPQDWSKKAVELYDYWNADGIVVEVNQGGDMVKHTIRSVRPNINVMEVRASRGKHVRAEPISALYANNQIGHFGTFIELENQMCQTTNAGYQGNGSPDRLDACVWGLTALFEDIVNRNQAKQNLVPKFNTSWIV